MRKLILIAVVSLLGLCFADEFTGFQGIPFGTPKDKSIELMKEIGWNYIKPRPKDKLVCFQRGKKQHTYAGIEVQYVFLDIVDDKLARVTITFSDMFKASQAKIAVINKYNLKNNSDSKLFYYTEDRKTCFSFSEATVDISDVELTSKQTKNYDDSDF